MRALLVVIDRWVDPCQCFGSHQIVEDLQCLEPVAKARVETFRVSVLPRLPGSMYKVSIQSLPKTPNLPNQFFNTLAMNSGPFSLRICLGNPRVLNKSANRSMMSSLVMSCSTSKQKFSRVNSSMITSHLSGRTLTMRSKIKSQLQTSLILSACRRSVELELLLSQRFLCFFCFLTL